jgi:phosphoribosylamine--glycine ligase
MSPAALVMPTRILIVGGGGREHALAWKLAAEPGVNAVWALPGSDAIASEPRVRRVADIDPTDGSGIAAFAAAKAIELVVVGPEAPLAAGVVDVLTRAGVAAFGPTADAARIESSKAFCRAIAEAAGVPTAVGRSFPAGAATAAVAYARDLAASGGGVVVKADGLAGGKGVTVCASGDEAEAAIAGLDGPLVVEERLAGREASLIALADGIDALALPLARDHKRLGDGDTGPNTGGMGAYSPLPDLPDATVDDLVERFHRPILAELARRGSPFRGALYAGLMLTSRGPRLLECNARFGDPEAQVLVPRLAAPLGPLLLASAKGRLGDARQALGLSGSQLPTIGGATVGIVLASEGYPGALRTGDRIEGLREAAARGGLVFHAGTTRDPDGEYRTDGGRVLTVVGRGPDLAAAREQAELAADAISWPGLQRRRDIGAAVPADASALAGAEVLDAAGAGSLR